MKIAISYRDEGKGKGAFFDHFTLRAITGVETEIVVQQNHAVTNFANLINYRNGHNEHGLPLNTSIPHTTSDPKESGFIFIPGYTRDSDNKKSTAHTQRLIFENELIAKARLRGQPVLAVCAGSWTLWQSYNGTIKEVSDHNYGGAMPRMSSYRPLVCNNKMIHKVVPKAGTYLAGTIKNGDAFPVNSVHWKAPDEPSASVASLLEVSGSSQQDNLIAPMSRQQHQMKPEDSIEAFETRFGVPMIGIQWHPEAFNTEEQGSSPHQAIFSFMVASGQTYLNRETLNQEFSALVSKCKGSFFAQGKISSEFSSKPVEVPSMELKG